MSIQKSNDRLNSFLTLVNSMIKETGLSMTLNTNCSDDLATNSLSQYQVNMFQFNPLIKDLQNNSSDESINNESPADDVWYTPRQDFDSDHRHPQLISHNSYLNANRIIKLGIEENQNLNKRTLNKSYNTITYNTANKIHKQRSMYISKVLRKYYKKINKTCKLDHMHNVANKIKTSKKKFNKAQSTLLTKQKLFNEKILPITEEKSEHILNIEKPRLNQAIKSRLPRYIELLNERKKREEFEKIVNESKKKIDENTMQLSIIERFRNSAIESSKMYRKELEKLKKEHESTVIQLEIIKHENSVLSKRLESELQQHEEGLSNDHTNRQNIITRADQQILSQNINIPFNLNQIKLNLFDLRKQLNAEKKLNTVMKVERKKIVAEFNKVQNELKTLREKYEKLNIDLQLIKSRKDDSPDERREIRQNIAELEQKSIEIEIAKVSKIMSDEIKISTEEKTQMLNIIRNLKQVIQVHKDKIVELLELNKQQNEVINEQKSKLNDRDEKIKCKIQMVELQRKEKIINEQKCQLDEINENVKTLNFSLVEKDALLKLNEELILKLQMNLEDMRLKWQKEREDSLVKNKIIDDQISTIQKLKSDYNGIHTNEMRKLNSELELSQRILLEEKKRYDTVAAKLLEITRDNEKLAYQLQKVKNLLAKYESNKYNVINVEILTELENKVIQKCKEWQTQKNILINEKNEAILAARYATQKFIETVLDFQKQIESQKIAQKTLTILVTEREKQFEIATAGICY
ncbi:rootletin-like [Chrysoperla carnea]|uniref:rootletin-like n=1 Tax=Chrysoperla carnea TaxID=189513 RepID=UPI001D082511|nr:rootletin-like [Chrysoperla carnea]